MTDFFGFLWASFLLLAPMLLLGLFLAGVIHVMISRQAILRWLRHDSLKSVSTSAAVGVPIPLCSCSVVPVVAEMRRKGASRSSCMSFLITAPETGADSILITNAFFGFLAAVARPVISFITAVVAGIFCIGLIRDRPAPHDHDHDHHDHDHDEHDHHDHGHEHHGHGHEGHEHAEHEPLMPGSDDCYVRPSQLKAALIGWARRTVQSVSESIGRRKTVTWVKPDFYRSAAAAEQPRTSPSRPTTSTDELDFKNIIKHVFRYGFVEIADDILFSLLVGVALGGVLYLVIPADLMANEYARWLSYPIMVLVGVPLYICASASTPIAAALVARGVSPGAALIFLMTGPATNTGTIAIIANQFGVRFASVYVTVVIAVTLAIGILIDTLLLTAGVTLSVNLGAAQAPAIYLIEWIGAVLLIALIVWRFKAGALKSGYQDLLSNLRTFSPPWKRAWRRLTRRRPLAGVISPTAPLGMTLWIALIAAFLATGFTAVPPESVGYGRLFGAVVWRDLPPGLHYLAPRPLVRIDHWPVREVKSVTNEVPFEYLSGEGNLLALSVNVQYRVRDPYVYHYRTENPERVITDRVRDEVRAFVAAGDLNQLLNVRRQELEAAVHGLFSGFEGKPTPVLQAVDLITVNLVAIQPIGETMGAFREISSSQEDRERYIVDAQRFMVSLIPRAHGNAVYEVEQAAGEAFRNVTTSAAEAEAIRMVSRAVQGAPDVLQNMLWREKLETALAGENYKIIVPSQDSLQKVALWKRSAARVPDPAHGGSTQTHE